MKGVVVICTHERRAMTCRNLDSLLNQTVKPLIVLCVTDRQDVKYYGDKYQNNVLVTQHANEPLGGKWQHAVNESKKLNPDFIVILGSDDMLQNTYIEKSIKYIEEGTDFIGLMRFWQHKGDKAYLCDYNPIQPIGGGRVYSRRMLEKINWQVFEPKNKHLDNYGWDMAKKSGLKCTLVRNIETQGMQIHAIKGDWKKMNDFSITHRNIKLLRSISLKENGNSFGI